MAREAATVASVLNKLTDSAFADLLSDRDKLAMTDFIEDFFCAPTNNHDGEDPGMSL